MLRSVLVLNIKSYGREMRPGWWRGLDSHTALFRGLPLFRIRTQPIKLYAVFSEYLILCLQNLFLASSIARLALRNAMSKSIRIMD